MELLPGRTGRYRQGNPERKLVCVNWTYSREAACNLGGAAQILPAAQVRTLCFFRGSSGCPSPCPTRSSPANRPPPVRVGARLMKQVGSEDGQLDEAELGSPLHKKVPLPRPFSPNGLATNSTGAEKPSRSDKSDSHSGLGNTRRPTVVMLVEDDESLPDHERIKAATLRPRWLRGERAIEHRHEHQRHRLYGVEGGLCLCGQGPQPAPF